jgi:hypothetical protein
MSFILFPSFVLFSCATFNPGAIEYHSALTSPGGKNTDSVYVYLKQFTYQEAKLIFDTDFRFKKFEPIYISIYNQSDKTIVVDPLNVLDIVDLDMVYKETKSAPLTYLLIWSTPWIINLVAGWPVYYGIAFPIIGIVSFAKSSEANTKRKDFYTSIYLQKVELLKGQEIFGIVFLAKDTSNPIQIKLMNIDNTYINFEFENKSTMYFESSK